MTPFCNILYYIHNTQIIQNTATGCHVKDPIALRHRISPALPKINYIKYNYIRIITQINKQFKKNLQIVHIFFTAAHFCTDLILITYFSHHRYSVV